MSEQDVRGEPQLDEEQASELCQLLTNLGVDEREARILAYLAENGDGRSAEMEEACRLRQPQVSQATTSMEERGWLETGREKTPGKGRPMNVYSLSLPLADIVEEVTARRRQKIDEDLARIDRVRAIVDVGPEQPLRTQQEA